MKPILEKKGFKLFFHNKETNKTFPVGWTNTQKGMLTKCKKLFRENEGSYFEYTFNDGVTIQLDLSSFTKLVEDIYAEPVEDETNTTDLSKSITNIKEAKKESPEVHAIPKQAEHGYLFCASKTCNYQIKIEGNLEYKIGPKIYLVCPKCGHKTKLHKVEKTNSLSYAVGTENKGTLIRPNGPKKHMNKKARLHLKRREN